MKKQTDYYQLVGELDGEYYFCDYIFKDGDFQGATATVVRPVEASDYNDKDSLRDWANELWRYAVENNDTELGLDDWIEYNDVDFDQRFDTGMDSRIYDKMRELYPDVEAYPVFECTGGGRSFSKGMAWDKVHDAALLAKIEKVEA